MRTLLLIFCSGTAFAQSAIPLTGYAAPGSYAKCCSDVPKVDWTFWTFGRKATPQFSNEHGVQVHYYGLFGQNDETNVSKRTLKPYNTVAYYSGSGQKFLNAGILTASGHGDAIVQSYTLNVYGRSNSAGDEGQYLYRGDIHHGTTSATTATIGTTSATSCNTTTTQAIVRSQDASTGQVATTITVSSTTGCNVNDWVTIESSRDGQGLHMNEEVVQITAVASGSITVVFLKDHDSGVTVTPARVVPISSGVYARDFGQDRYLVNLTQAVVGAGNVDAGGSGSLTITGHSTAFANNLVGGTAANPGCISLDQDTVDGVRDWWPIDVIASATSLTITSQTGTRLVSATASAYSIAPCARIRNFVFNTSDPPSATSLVLSNNPFTWTATNSVECAVSPDPSIAGFRLLLYPTRKHAAWNPIIDLDNQGSRDILNAAHYVHGSTSGGWNTGYLIKNAKQGVVIVSDGVHIGEALAVTSAAGDKKEFTWNGTMTGGMPMAWRFGPVDATGDWALSEDYTSTFWTAYQRSTSSQLGIFFNRVIKANGYQSSDGTAGASATVTVKGSDGNNCNLVYKNGLYVSTTCP